MKNKILLACIFLLSIQFNYAQISYKKRIEFELNNGYTNEKILEFGENGFIISSRAAKTSKKGKEWKYEKFDTNLKRVKSKSIYLGKKFYSDESYTSSTRNHRFFRDKKGNFTLVTINALNLEIEKVSGVLPKKTSVRDMAVIGDFAFLKAVSKKQPFLFSINWKTGAKRLIPLVIEGAKMKKVSVKNFQVSEQNNEIYVFVKVPKSKKASDLHVIRLNSFGEKQDQFNLTAEIDKNIVEITASKVTDDEYIYTGTYSSKYINQSEGIFFCTAQRNKINQIEFYNFLDLENFLSYLPEKRQEKIKKKQQKKANKGKELTFNYSICPHDIIKTDDGYIFIGEAYYETYRTETRQVTSTVNGVTTTRTETYQVFDGYQYTHAMVAKFSHQGKLIWDQTFEMWSAYKPFYVKKFISIAEKNPKSLQLVYTSRNKIYAKSFGYDGQVQHASSSKEIKTGKEGDKVKYAFSNLDFWFDNFFIAYGKQKIKNTATEGKRKRKVLFVSKIQYK